MNGSIVAQAGIMAFGVSAIWLVGQTNPKVRRWGFVCGICSQPFWLYTTITHEQWGIAAMSLLYAASWANGLRKNWRITTAPAKEAD